MKTTRLLLPTLLATLFATGSAIAEQYAVLATTYGPITIQLDDEKAPISVENFEAYAKDGFYDNTVFHRVIPDFMIQGGGFDHHGNYPQGIHDKSAHGGIREPIKNEWENGLKNTRGSIAMARLGGQADSATSQFFINLKDNGFLDQPRDGAGYAVFGKVISGMDVVDEIAGVQTVSVGRMANVPAREVLIKTVKMLSRADAMAYATRAEVTAAEARLESARKALADAEQAVREAEAACEEARKKAAGQKAAPKNPSPPKAAPKKAVDLPASTGGKP